jgi:hypothetical protein
MITTMIGRAMKGDKVKDEVEDELVNSWIFDKCMLYARIEELNWIQDVNYPEEIQRLKKIWLERRGM